MRLPFVSLLPLVLLTACAGGLPGSFEPERLHRVQIYGGAPLARSEVATLYAMDGRPHFESATICEIDGVSLERGGVCASVAWVLPGEHVVKLRYTSSRQFGSAGLNMRVEPGRLYQLNLSSLGTTSSRGLVTVIPAFAGATLSWRNIAPGLAAGSPRIDEAVPYAANTELAARLPEPPLSPDERAVADRVLACAGTYAVETDLLKVAHRDWQPALAQQGAFLQIAGTYLPDDEARREFVAAQARARAINAPAFDFTKSADPQREQAFDRLGADMHACDAFRRDHADEFSARYARHPTR